MSGCNEEVARPRGRVLGCLSALGKMHDASRLPRQAQAQDRPTEVASAGKRRMARPKPLVVAIAAAVAWAILSVGPADLAADVGRISPSHQATRPSCPLNATPVDGQCQIGIDMSGLGDSPATLTDPTCDVFSAGFGAVLESDGLCHVRTQGTVELLVDDLARGMQNGLLAFLAVGLRSCSGPVFAPLASIAQDRQMSESIDSFRHILWSTGYRERAALADAANADHGSFGAWRSAGCAWASCSPWDRSSRRAPWRVRCPRRAARSVRGSHPRRERCGSDAGCAPRSGRRWRAAIPRRRHRRSRRRGLRRPKRALLPSGCVEGSGSSSGCPCRPDPTTGPRPRVRPKALTPCGELQRGRPIAVQRSPGLTLGRYADGRRHVRNAAAP